MNVDLPCPTPFQMTASTLEYTWMWYIFHEFMAVCKQMYRHLHVVNLIVTQQTRKTPLHCAASAKVVDALLKAGSKVDEKDQVSMF